MSGTRKYGGGGGISRDFLARMRAAADLGALVGERVHLQKRGANLFGLCPFHAEKTPSFSVNPAKGFYHCFGCGANGDALNFVIQTEAGGDFVAGVEALAARLGMKVPRGDSSESDAVVEVLADAQKYFRREFSRAEAAKEYLQKRGVNDETIARFGIGFAPAGWRNLRDAMRGRDEKVLIRAGLLRANEKGAYDYFRNRLIFPIMEGQNRAIGFGGRALDDDPAKYLNSPDSPVFSKKNSVFGIPQAREAAREKKRVIVAEGYMDVAMLSQHGFAESVAVMGTALTARQMLKIARMAENVIFALDGDEAGRKAAMRGVAGILPALSDGMSAAFLFLPAGEDPDSFVRKNGAEELERAIAKAIPLGDYLAENLRENAAAQTDEGRAARILSEGEKLARLLDSGRAPFLREVLMQKFAAAADISAAAMRRVSARGNARTAGANARWTMRETGLLFNLLCSLAARPRLIGEFSENPPLPGDARESALAAEMLNYARLQTDDGEEPDIAAHLAAEGYAALSLQVRETVRQRYAAAADPRAEFAVFAERLKREQEKHERMRRRSSSASERV